MTRGKTGVALLESCLNVYKNTPPLKYLGGHVLKLKDIWLTHIGKDAIPTLKKGQKRNLESVFERDEPPKKKKKNVKETANQRRSAGRWRRRNQKRKLFESNVDKKYSDKDKKLKQKRRKLSKYD